MNPISFWLSTLRLRAPYQGIASSNTFYWLGDYGLVPKQQAVVKTILNDCGAQLRHPSGTVHRGIFESTAP